MAFDLTKSGNIDSLPPFTYEAAVLADVGCLLRLVLARHVDERETDALCVQLTMSAEQLDGLVQELQKILAQISQNAPKGHRH